MNSYISLYSGTISSREHEVPLRDVLPDSREINPEELVIGREDRDGGGNFGYGGEGFCIGKSIEDKKGVKSGIGFYTF